MKRSSMFLWGRLGLLFLGALATHVQAETKAELRDHFLSLKFGMFIHFNMGTYHNKEWVEPGKDPASFNPTKLDVGQWADAAASAGMKYAVLTAKHHDGFCLWDTAVTDYDIASTPLAGRDIVNEYCEAFRARGLEPHLYFSIWDRTLGIEKKITADDIARIKIQLTELLTNYGYIPTLTFDGWGNCGTQWADKDYWEIYNYVKEISPNTLVTDHYQVFRVKRGEISYADAYAINDFLHFEEPFNEAPAENPFASHQGPTMQSKWFWKTGFPQEELMPVEDIVEKRLRPLNKRNCNLLLNAAPNRAGLMDDNVTQRLKEVGAALAEETREAKGSPPVYEPTWESLAQHNIEPEWFKDAKFGIYFTWGPFSVPAFDGEWYPAWMYYPDRQGWGEAVYEHHRKTWGEDFDYHQFIPLFKAEHFDAAAWADLFKQSGAKFAGPCVEHHDGFAMWDSEINMWNAADMGPKQDITGELLAELKKRGMKTITTFHHARNLQRSATNESVWAGSGQVDWNSHYPYHPDLITSTTDPKLKYLYGNIPAEEFNKRWLGQVNEVVDQYAPDMIWFDSWLGQIPVEYRRQAVAHHYNTALSRGQEPMSFCKWGAIPKTVALQDIEQGGKTNLSERFWLTDITIGDGSWCYTEGLKYKKSSLVIRNMIDVWSKNGVVLLNVSPRADGIIPAEQIAVLNDIGTWINQHEEAVYPTRAHSTFGYGVAGFEKGKYGGQKATIEYTQEDIRFSKSKDGKILYIYVLGLPEAHATLEVKHAFESNPGQKVSRVSVLGSGAKVRWRAHQDILGITTPAAKDMNEIATVFRVEFE